MTLLPVDCWHCRCRGLVSTILGNILAPKSVQISRYPKIIYPVHCHGSYVNVLCVDDYMQNRVNTLRKAMRAAGAEKDATLPVAFIENSSHCATNEAGEKVIGVNKDRRWLPDLMTQVDACMLMLHEHSNH